MEQYDKNVTVILEFLVAENFSSSVISMHRLCYKALRKHLTEEKYFILQMPHIDGLMTTKLAGPIGSILAGSIALTSWKMYMPMGSYYLITWVQGAQPTAYCQKH